MGKAKKATRKELETVIGQIIGELKNLRTGFQSLDNYIGHYVEWKGDRVSFENHLTNKFEKMKSETDSPIVEAKDNKSEKKDRYKKVSTV